MIGIEKLSIEDLVGNLRTIRTNNGEKEQARKAGGTVDRIRFLDDLPERFTWANKDAPEMAHRVSVVKDHRKAIDAIVRAPWVTIFGAQTGLGKTSLINAAAREWVAVTPREIVNRAYYTRAREMALEVRWAALGKIPESIARVRDATHWILDGFGTEEKHFTNPFADLINIRKEENMRTWVTTHMTEKEVKFRYGVDAFRALIDGALVIGDGEFSVAA